MGESTFGARKTGPWTKTKIQVSAFLSEVPSPRQTTFLFSSYSYIEIARRRL